VTEARVLLEARVVSEEHSCGGLDPDDAAAGSALPVGTEGAAESGKAGRWRKRWSR